MPLVLPVGTKSLAVSHLPTAAVPLHTALNLRNEQALAWYGHWEAIICAEVRLSADNTHPYSNRGTGNTESVVTSCFWLFLCLTWLACTSKQHLSTSRHVYGRYLYCALIKKQNFAFFMWALPFICLSGIWAAEGPCFWQSERILHTV